MLRPLTERKIMVTGLVVTVLTLIVSFGAVRGYMIYKISADLAVMRDEFHADQQERKSHEEALRAELDIIERTLYAAPTTPPPPIRRESAVEQWMLNYKKENDARFRALEQWRYRTEQR